MSRYYETTKHVPNKVIANRLRELSAASKNRDLREREFTMRIPAECDRDADLVLMEAARRIEMSDEFGITGSDGENNENMGL